MHVDTYKPLKQKDGMNLLLPDCKEFKTVTPRKLETYRIDGKTDPYLALSTSEMQTLYVVTREWERQNKITPSTMLQVITMVNLITRDRRVIGSEHYAVTLVNKIAEVMDVKPQRLTKLLKIAESMGIIERMRERRSQYGMVFRFPLFGKPY